MSVPSINTLKPKAYINSAAAAVAANSAARRSARRIMEEVEGVGGDRKAVADQVLGLYGLVARFSAVLENATAEAWKVEKAKLPAELDDDEQVAIETGLAVGLRTRLLVEIEHATRAFALPRLREGDEPTRRALVAAVGQCRLGLSYHWYFAR